MADTSCKRSVYMLQGLPAGMFGEAYVVVTGIELPHAHFRTEQFILTQRPREMLHMNSFEIDGNTFPSELGKVDVDFALAEGLTRAESIVLDLLEKRANELGRAELAYHRFDLVSRPSPFVGCKMRGRFVEQLTQIKNATQCRAFSSYLALLDQVAVVG